MTPTETPSRQDQLRALEDLRSQVKGRVLTDPVNQLLYSTDASAYQETPLGAVLPESQEDLVAIARFAQEHKISLIPRAAGTSLAGQCVGAGLVVDTSKMNQVVDIDPSRNKATVQPGVILDDLNDHLSPHGLIFGPETSTSNRCMLGGMIGNNACGTHSIIWGTTRDHTVEIDAVLSDGSTATFKDLTRAELEEKKKLDNLEGQIYREVCRIIDENRDKILECYPKQDILRRNTGYALDSMAIHQPWNPQGQPFNLARLLCGSEGTLAMTSQARLNLAQLPKHKLLVCAHFNTLDASMHGTILAVKHDPAAVELMDDKILEATYENIEQTRNRFWVEGTPAAVLVVELFDDDAQNLENRAQALIADYKSRGLGYAFPIVRPPDLGRVWALRKAGLGLLMGVPGDVKAVTVIEDTAVAVDDLPAFTERMEEMMQKYGTQCVYYAHVSVGEMHLRPTLNIKTREGLDAFKGIASDTADLVSEFGGSLSGEHGDGRLRAPFVSRMLGEEVYALLRELKRAFDPNNLLNPHKIVDPLPIDADLRISPDTPIRDRKTFFNWDADQGLLRAAEKCNGAGACRKSPGRGTMCPSYMVTRDEKDATRGRANLFRRVLTELEPHEALEDDDLNEILNLCLSCKGCKSECPASVDMARMKAEYLQQRYDARGTPLKARIFGEFGRLTSLARWTPKLASGLLNTSLNKKILGVHPKRTIPKIASQTFGAWAKRRTPHNNAGTRGHVVVFNDAFTHYNDPHVGIAAVQFLEMAGWKVTVTHDLESARTQISKGLLRRAKEVLRESIEALHEHASQGTAIIGLEPSAILTFRDEAPDLVDGEDLRAKARTVAENAFLIEEFIAREIREGRLDALPFSSKERRYLLHGHCHQKAIAGVQDTVKILGLLPNTQVDVIPSGCCGMAGSFGYEKKHYEFSMKIGEMVLFPAIREAEDGTQIVAPGTSCRHQIHDGTGARALHPAEILRDALAEGLQG